MDALNTVALLLGVVISVGSIVGIIFKFVIIQPLETAIKNLSKLIAEIQEEVKESNTDRRRISIDLEALKHEYRADSENLSKRVEKLEDRVYLK